MMKWPREQLGGKQSFFQNGGQIIAISYRGFNIMCNRIASSF